MDEIFKPFEMWVRNCVQTILNEELTLVNREQTLPLFLSTKELCKLLGCSERTLPRFIGAPDFPRCEKRGNRVLWPRDAIVEYCKEEWRIF